MLQDAKTRDENKMTELPMVSLSKLMMKNFLSHNVGTVNYGIWFLMVLVRVSEFGK